MGYCPTFVGKAGARSAIANPLKSRTKKAVQMSKKTVSLSPWTRTSKV